MPELRGQRLEPAARRRLIEEAATRLFAQRGYLPTTVEDIVQAAGVTKPMLYRHFESKQELCVALLERYRDELVAAPLSVFKSADTDWRGQLRAMGDAWLGYIEQHPEGARLLLTPIHGDPEVERVQHELYSRQRETQAALLREFARDVDAVEAEALGEALRAALVAVALWWLDNPGHPREVALRALLRVPEGMLMTLPGGGRP
jgi:AcrR family transcriptional regulator